MDKILVTDDEPDILNLAKLNLEAAGFEVITATNAEETLSKADSELPDLVLHDVVMPGMGGFEVCKILKEQSKTRLIPVVLFTALGRDVDRKMGSDAGADGFVTKPFTSEELVSEIEKQLKRIRPEKFCKTLNLDHSDIRGRKLLLEFDPVTPYERAVRDFAMEALAHDEAVTVLRARTSSAVSRALEGERDVDFAPLKHLEFLSPILEGKRGIPHALIFDSLTDLILSSGPQSAYTHLNSSLNRLQDSNITTLFLLNQEAHTQRETSLIRGIFSDQLAFGKDGLKKTRLL